MTRASFRSFALASFFLLAGATLPACGGTGDLGDIFGTSGGQGTPTGSGGGGPGGAGPGGAGPGGAGQGGAGQGGAGQSSSSASSSSMASSSSSSSSMASSSSGGPAAMVACGDTSCPIGPDQACCYDNYEINPPPQGECVTGPVDNDNCSTGTTGRESRIECQLPEHCPSGTVCCGDLNNSQNGNWYGIVRCVAQCPYPGEITLCDPQNPQCPVVQTGQGPVQTVCGTSMILPPGYAVCRVP